MAAVSEVRDVTAWKMAVGAGHRVSPESVRFTLKKGPLSAWTAAILHSSIARSTRCHLPPGLEPATTLDTVESTNGTRLPTEVTA